MKIMGIDLGIHKVAYAVWEDGLLIATESYETSAGTRQEQLLHLGDFIYESVHHIEPEHVFIEDVLIGNNRKYSMQLAETKGAVLAHMGLLEMEQGLSVYMVNVSTWKKEVIGSGRADKKAIQEYLWSMNNAYSVLCGHQQDRFDAACIGYYGVLIESRASKVMEAARSASSGDRTASALADTRRAVGVIPDQGPLA